VGDVSSPQIKVSLAREGSETRLSVTDNGPGVPADRREDVVKRFVRLDESRSKPGTGLGLSLVQAVAALHGGRLELKDGSPEAEANTRPCCDHGLARGTMTETNAHIRLIADSNRVRSARPPQPPPNPWLLISSLWAPITRRLRRC
jgi:signal transduction histidine kinase